MLFCGIDLGTQGARCVVVDEAGALLAEASQALERSATGRGPQGRFEQDPARWLEAVRAAVCGAVQSLATSGRSPGELSAIGVTSTSGTVCALDRDFEPLRPAIMYSDSRSSDEAEQVQQAGTELAASLGYRFKPSFALPKILWLKHNEPDCFERARLFVSPTDFVIGWLTGRWGTTDQTNALKWGYDLLRWHWPHFIEAKLGILLEKLPRVEMSGQRVGDLCAARANELGLPCGIPVAAGLTDGCASQVSSGAVRPGDFNTTIGTTLVLKGVTRRLLLDAEGRIYCHRHPCGWWLPGGASNTGAECLAVEFGQQETELRSARALSVSPTDLVAYPLVGKGERFPFSCPEAEVFLLGEPRSRDELFAAYLEGVACLERLAFEVLRGLGAEVGERVFSAGGGSRSEAWLQIRADVLGRAILRPAVSGAAMGAAITAASMKCYRDLAEAAAAMVKIEMRKTPRPDFASAYAEKYDRFRAECVRRGYIKRCSQTDSR